MGITGILQMLIGWGMFMGLIGAVLLTLSKINSLSKELNELRDDMRAVRDRVETMPTLQ